MAREKRRGGGLALPVGMLGVLAALGACSSAETGNSNNGVGNCPAGQAGCLPSGDGDGDGDGDQGPVPGDGGGASPKTRLPCEIQDFFSERCGMCHNENGDFGAPMSLLTWEPMHEQAIKTPELPVYEAVLARMNDDREPMPPIPAPRATDEEKQLIQSWINAGAPARAEGETCESDPVPTTDGGVVDPGSDGGYVVEQSGGPDDCDTYYELRAHGAQGEDDRTPFPVNAQPINGGNQYQCFYFKPPYKAEDQALWFAPIIDNTRVIHHWLLYGTDLMTQIPGSSSPCTAAQPGNYLLAGWAPGTPETSYPADVGLQMPTSGLILEVHYYNSTGEEQKDRSGVKFCTARKNTREHTAAVHFTGSEGICIAPNAEHDVAGVCDPADNQEIHLVDIWPHMHTKGVRMKLELVKQKPGTGGFLQPPAQYDVLKVLHNEPFNFEYQVRYPLNLTLKPGEQLRTTCYYENTENGQVRFGEQTQEEMCYGFITAWPAGALVTDPAVITSDPISIISQGLQPARRCLNPLSIMESCGGLGDYPSPL